MKRYLFILLAISSFCFVYLQAQDYSWVTCPKCNGSKKEVVNCSECTNGTVPCYNCIGGEITERCPKGCTAGYFETKITLKCTSCNGAKFFRENLQEPCNHCRGTGKRSITNNRQVTGRGGQKTSQTRTTQVNCNICKGSGLKDNYVNVACRTCGGTGKGEEKIKITYCTCDAGWIKKDCPECNNGRKLCPECKGTSRIQKKCSECNGYGKVMVNNK